MTPAFRIHLAAFLFLLLMVGGAGRLIYIEMSEKTFFKIRVMPEPFEWSGSMPIAA